MISFKAMSLAKVLFFLYCILITFSHVLANNNGPFPAFKKSDYRKIHQLYDVKNKVYLGSVYVKYITDTVFTSLVVINENKVKDVILYYVDSTRFMKKDGLDTEVYEDGFYGYIIVDKKDDYIVLNYLRNEGKHVSDNIRIKWNYSKKKFHIFKF